MTSEPVIRALPLLVTVLSILALSAVGVAALWDLFLGDLKCEVVGADSVWGEASWSWARLGTTCDYSGLPGEGVVSGAGLWRLPVTVVSAGASATVLLRGTPSERRWLGIALALFALFVGAAAVLASEWFDFVSL